VRPVEEADTSSDLEIAAYFNLWTSFQWSDLDKEGLEGATVREKYLEISIARTNFQLSFTDFVVQVLYP